MKLKRLKIGPVVSTTSPHYIVKRLILLAFTTALLSHTPKGQALPSDQYLGIKNQIPSDSDSYQQSDARVRLGLRLIFFKDGQKTTHTQVPVVDRIKNQTLRAKALRANHFYVDHIHIFSEPTKWNKKTNAYQMRLSFFEAFGAKRQVEEKIGEMTLNGVLKGKNGVFILHGLAKSSFKDKFGHLKLQVLAGYHPADSGAKGKIARATRR